MSRISDRSRRDEPVRLVEQIVVALGLREGEPVSTLARQLRRPIPQVRRWIRGARA